MPEDIIKTRKWAVTKALVRIMRHQKGPPSPKKERKPSFREKPRESVFGLVFTSVFVGIISVALDLALGVLLVALLSMLLSQM